MLAGLAAVLVLGTVTVPAAVADEEDVTAVPSTPSTTAPPSTTTPTTPVESDEPPVSGADLAVEASVGDGQYLLGEEMPVTVTVTNIGDADAHEVIVDLHGEDDFSVSVPREQWKGFTWPDGATLRAGATVAFDLAVTPKSWESGEVAAIRVSAQSPDEVRWSNNEIGGIVVPVVPPTPTHPVTGTVYGDGNGNGVLDDGEGLAGVTIQLNRFPGNHFRKVKTGSDGRFAFDDVSAGLYELSVSGTDWIGPYSIPVRVDGSGDHTDLRLRRTRPVSDVLVPTVKFTQDTYRPGDTAQVTVTLTNNGDEPLRGVTAFCSGAGNSDELGGVEDAEHWGDLVWGSKGVTVPAHTTKTYQVTGVVRDGAADYGFVTLGCDFGPGEDISGHPHALDRAKVPGRTADAAVKVFHDRDEDGVVDDDEYLSGVTVGLRDRDADTPMVTAETDERGRAAFADHQAGMYHIEVFGPWQRADGAALHLLVHAEYSLYYNTNTVEVVPGPNKPLPGAGGDGGDAPTGSTPADSADPVSKQAQDVDELASTGVDAVTLGGVGLAVLLAGAVTLVVARRRRAEGSTES